MNNNYLSYDALCAKATETVYLFERLWRKNTTALLFTPIPESSTAFALEVAQSVCDSSSENLLFIDVFENLTDHIRRLPRFSNFLTVSPQADDGNEDEDYAETLLKTIERAATNDGINIFIINSLSRAAALLFGRSSSAGHLMKRIVALQRRLGISILVVASKSTRPVDNTLRLLATESFTTDDIEALHPEVLYPQPQEPEQPCTKKTEESQPQPMEYMPAEETQPVLDPEPPYSAYTIESGFLPKNYHNDKTLSRRQRRALERKLKRKGATLIATVRPD